ncbi:uncharacterized protein LOC122307345 [Carya illinoinensis]|uniref:uncharacterized protein LOC122307345 n=1 Tax=Carya illinoinensis TaxID=32201 RepID=UPI001C7287FF|nr:uncharacterized protein LOC122307345 [Carya illinoinensis]
MGGKLVKEELIRREGISWRVERTFGSATIQTRPPTTAITQTTTMKMKIRIAWQPFATQNPAFDEYYRNLWKRGGSLELFDVFCELPQLVHRLGLKKWKVCIFSSMGAMFS